LRLYHIPSLNRTHRYAYGKGWADMAYALRQSAKDTLCDEMIQLCHESKNLNAIPPVRVVIYGNVEDIPFRIRNLHPHLKSILRADAAPFVPVDRSVPPVTDEGKNVSYNAESVPTGDVFSEGVESEDLAAEDTTNDEEAFDNPAVEAVALSDPVDIPQSVATSDTEIQAARIIASIYKRALSRRNGVAKSGLAASRAAIYDKCYAEDQKMDWPKRHYRLLFRGPLVHALLCLELINKHVHSLKVKTKKRLSVAVYEELEEVKKTQTELT
jgi:hypothetical protein